MSPYKSDKDKEIERLKRITAQMERCGQMDTVHHKRLAELLAVPAAKKKVSKPKPEKVEDVNKELNNGR